MFNPFENYIGNFGHNDGSIDFYLRVQTLASPDKTFLDFGAGRGEWYEDDHSSVRRDLRTMRGRFREVIAADVDPIVLQNRASDRQLHISNGRVPLESNSIDVIVSDYVLEHVSDRKEFADEVDRLLVPGGWFCARTPHRWNYVGVASRVFTGDLGDQIVTRAQPNRKEEDVFPKYYRMNSIGDIENVFPNYQSFSYVRRMDPSYFFGRRWVYNSLDFFHRIMPAAFSGNLYVFLKKPKD